MHAALAAALEELPEGVRSLAISRAPPPGAYVRATSAQAIGIIEATALRFTPLIRDFAIAPPLPDPSAWPLAIRITTLGRFAIERDCQPLLAARKDARKPNELLRLVIAGPRASWPRPAHHTARSGRRARCSAEPRDTAAGR